MRAHAFFADVAWELIEARKLPAPFVPNRDVVYASDFLTTISQQELAKSGRGKVPTPERGTEPRPTDAVEALSAADFKGDRWDYVCSTSAYAEELAECARTADVAALLKAPSSPLVDRAEV